MPFLGGRAVKTPSSAHCNGAPGSGNSGNGPRGGERRARGRWRASSHDGFGNRRAHSGQRAIWYTTRRQLPATKEGAGNARVCIRRVPDRMLGARLLNAETAA
jgi:hypothetical protein